MKMIGDGFSNKLQLIGNDTKSDAAAKVHHSRQNGFRWRTGGVKRKLLPDLLGGRRWQPLKHRQVRRHSIVLGRIMKPPQPVEPCKIGGYEVGGND